MKALRCARRRISSSISYAEQGLRHVKRPIGKGTRVCITGASGGVGVHAIQVSIFNGIIGTRSKSRFFVL